jgi:hypothetical protein
VCAALLALLATLAGCGSSADPPPSARAAPSQQLYEHGAPAKAPCAQEVVQALGSIAKHVYLEGDGGRIAQQALFRLRESPSLRRAIEVGGQAEIRHVLAKLAESQIVRSSVTTASHTLAQEGNADAIAPLTEVIKGAGGRGLATVHVSVLGANGYAATLIGLIGAKAVVRAGSIELGSTIHGAPKLHIPNSGTVTYKGSVYHVISFGVEAFSGRQARASLLIPSPSSSVCGSTPAQTWTNAIGAVGERIYQDEASGGKTIVALRTAESSSSFARAVATGDLAATRAAIIEFFKNRSHVVRVRVYRHGKLFLDVGGPHVLAPATGTLHYNGTQVGTFQLAIQDDLGYTLLAHNFTGAQVLMRTPTGQVEGTLKPGPTSIPDRGALTYKGVRYQAFTFQAQAFPSGPLRISLLVS